MKPIMQVERTHGYKYKYCHSGYAAGVEIKFDTDLTYREFEKLLNGEYTGEQIRKFEICGKF
jgi:hypothetical protein